ncbi:MAG TPA: hypothetical protein DCS09_04730 [Porphyromonadaceae bacterium]|nr:hypothetical protein [Porphyromonadaceae bacterium]
MERKMSGDMANMADKLEEMESEIENLHIENDTLCLRLQNQQPEKCTACQAPKSCTWEKQEKSNRWWKTGCGNTWMLDDWSTPITDGIIFCPVCGGTVTVKLQS